MTNHQEDETGRRLTRELHRRTDGMHSTPLTFDDVRGKAVSIRRRRRVATGLGVAAAVAVIVPTSIFASNQVGRSDAPLPATQPPSAIDTNSPTPSSTPTMGSDPHALEVRDLPTGAPPAVPLVTNGDLAAAETGEAVVRWTPDGVVVETGGQTFGPYPSSHGLARNDNGTSVAWATDEGDVMVYADGAGQPEQVMHSDLVSLEVAALTGTDCIRGKASDCTYYVNGYNMETNQSEAFTISGDGGTGPADVPDPSILAVTDATADGRVLGLTEIRDDGSCSAAFDPASGSTPLLETCDHTLDAFSPNGDYVLASESYHDGIGSNRIAVYATAGDLMADRANTDRRLVFYNDAVWEDDTHVLFSVYSDGMWSIVRMDVNGAMEYAVPPQEGEAEQVPWHFETR